MLLRRLSPVSSKSETAVLVKTTQKTIARCDGSWRIPYMFSSRYNDIRSCSVMTPPIQYEHIKTVDHQAMYPEQWCVSKSRLVMLDREA